MRFRRLWVALGATGMALVVPLLLAGPAAAQSGALCHASINGMPIEAYSSPSKALRVGSTDRVAVSGSVFRPSGFVDEEVLHHEVQLQFAGVGWTVDSDDTTGTDWDGTVSVKKYAKHGEGLYKVVAAAVSSNGIRCRQAAYVRVGDANPLDTTAGKAAAGVAAVGAAGTLLGGRKQFGSVDEEMDRFEKGLSDAESTDDAAAARDRAEQATWQAGTAAEVERLRALRDSEERKLMAACASVAVAAVGLTALALMQDAARQVVAVIGRLPR